MDYSKDGLQLTKLFEGCRLKAYRDVAGIWTIGYGHTAGVRQGDVITQEQADAFLLADIQICVEQINRNVKVPLTQGEFDALVDFAFNLGCHALEGSTLWRKVQAGDFAGAAEQFPRWVHAGGREVAGLVRRRLAEQSMFLGAQHDT